MPTRATSYTREPRARATNRASTILSTRFPFRAIDYKGDAPQAYADDAASR